MSAGLLLTAALLILRLPAYAVTPQALAPALAIDLLVGLPFLGYLFLVRTGAAHILVLAPLLVIGIVLTA